MAGYHLRAIAVLSILCITVKTDLAMIPLSVFQLNFLQIIFDSETDLSFVTTKFYNKYCISITHFYGYIALPVIDIKGLLPLI